MSSVAGFWSILYRKKWFADGQRLSCQLKLIKPFLKQACRFKWTNKDLSRGQHGVFIRVVHSTHNCYLLHRSWQQIWTQLGLVIDEFFGGFWVFSILGLFCILKDCEFEAFLFFSFKKKRIWDFRIFGVFYFLNLEYMILAGVNYMLCLQ